MRALVAWRRTRAGECYAAKAETLEVKISTVGQGSGREVRGRGPTFLHRQRPQFTWDTERRRCPLEDPTGADAQ